MVASLGSSGQAGLVLIKGHLVSATRETPVSDKQPAQLELEAQHDASGCQGLARYKSCNVHEHILLS